MISNGKSDWMRWTPTRKYENLEYSPDNVVTDFSDDVQGICHDDEYWYISHGAGSLNYSSLIGGRNYGVIHQVPLLGLDKKINYRVEQLSEGCKVYSKGKLLQHRFYKYYSLDSGKPVGIKVGEIHFGDIDYYQGFIFVPVFQSGKEGDVDAQILVFSTQTFDCVWRERLKKKGNVYFEKLLWCAVNPLDGCLYTSDTFISSSFEGDHSPIMAFKINVALLKKLEKVKNRDSFAGSVFTSVNKDGIILYRGEKTGSGEFKARPYEIDARMQGGCFDSFDTLYLCAGFGSHEKHDGVTAFVLFRDHKDSTQEFIQTRAYYIWKDKGAPLQSEAERKKDWFEASWQINSAVQSGFIRFDGPAFAGLACTKSDGSDESAIDFTFDGKYLFYPEEPEGITYWDLRKYAGKSDCGWLKGCLHVLKLKNNATYILGGIDSFSVQNYVLRNLESPIKCMYYDPNRLEIKYNPISKRWVVVGKDNFPLKEFKSKNEAENAVLVMRNFKTILKIGRYAADESQHDYCYDFLDERVSNSINTNNVEKESFRFDTLKIEDQTEVSASKWLSDYAVVMSYNKKPVVSLPVNCCLDGNKVESIYSQIAKKNNGKKTSYINNLKLSSKEKKDNLYWFE